MGRWAQYRHRGRGEPFEQTLGPPADADWNLNYNAGTVAIDGQFVGGAPGAAFFVMRWSYDDASWVDTPVASTAAGICSADVDPLDFPDAFAQIAFCDSLANLLSDWSVSKTVPIG